MAITWIGLDNDPRKIDGSRTNDGVVVYSPVLAISSVVFLTELSLRLICDPLTVDYTTLVTMTTDGGKVQCKR